MPPVLVINFKRFRGSHAKQNAFVEFPVKELDLSDYVVSRADDRKPIYDLFAISNHFGQLQAGHYTALVKNREQWY